MAVKNKVHSGAKKRFKRTAKGYKRAQSFIRHILTKKSSKRKRQLGSPAMVCQADKNSVARMLGDK